MIKRILEIDRELLVFLNNLGSEFWDPVWLLITDKLTFVPIFLFLMLFVAASNAMEKILYDELPYVVLFNPPVLEVYRSDSISLPFTDVLGGITDACTGCASTVKTQN